MVPLTRPLLLYLALLLAALGEVHACPGVEGMGCFAGLLKSVKSRFSRKMVPEVTPHPIVTHHATSPVSPKAEPEVFHEPDVWLEFDKVELAKRRPKLLGRGRLREYAAHTHEVDRAALAAERHAAEEGAEGKKGSSAEGRIDSSASPEVIPLWKQPFNPDLSKEEHKRVWKLKRQVVGVKLARWEERHGPQLNEANLEMKPRKPPPGPSRLGKTEEEEHFHTPPTSPPREGGQTPELGSP